MPGECCLHVTALRWEHDHKFRMFQMAIMLPERNMHVWGALGAVILTSIAAVYVGFTARFESQRRRLKLPPDEADLMTSRITWIFVWCALQVTSAVGSLLSLLFGRRFSGPVINRFSCAFTAAASTLLESLSFWFDMLWLTATWGNHDVRYKPYAVGATWIYVVGCGAYALLSLRLILSDLRTSRAPLLDWPLVKTNPALWSLVLLASWGATPRLLQLLPWTSRRYGDLPTLGAMNGVFAIKSTLKAALIGVKIALLLHLEAAENMIAVTIFFNGICFVRGTLERALAMAAIHLAKTRWQRISIFLSYRGSADAPLVEALYNELTGLGLRVWWDKKCLQPGHRWEDGFADGLFSSRVFVPVLSQAGLANFAVLDTDSACDNVLLEHLLALEQEKRGKMKAVFPIFVGQVLSSGRHGHFFKEKTPSFRTDIVVEAVDAKAREHLQRHCRGGLPVQLHVADRSPGGVYAQLKSYQGNCVQGGREDSLRCIAHEILDMVKDVAESKVSAEAQEETQVSAQRSPISLRMRRSWMSQAHLVSWRRSTALLSPSARSDGGSSARSELGLSPSAISIGAEGSWAADANPIEQCFSTSFRDESTSGEAINPVLVLKAKKQREKSRQPKPGSPQKSGGLKVLLPPTELTLRPDQEIERYMRSEQVEMSAHNSHTDESEAAIALHTHQVSHAIAHRTKAAQRSRVQRARNWMEGGGHSSSPNRDASALAPQREDRLWSIAGQVMKRAGNRAGSAVRSVKVGASQRA